MKETKTPRAEKCGICFFVNNKAIFTLVKTKDEKFDEGLMQSTYLRNTAKKK